MTLNPLNILITGASSGIGQSAHDLLLRSGHKILTGSRRSKDPKNILDVSKVSSIEAFFKTHQNFLKSIDVLINNAGLALGMESFQNSNREDLHQVIETNIIGLMEITRRVLPFMVTKKAGHIINMGSVAAHTAYPGGAVYCASKAAVHQFSQGLKRDLAGTGIRVCTIAPGKVQTDFSITRFRGDEKKADAVYRGYRPLKPQDIAETIEWVITRPSHVDISDITLWPTDQPSIESIVPS